MKFRKKLLANPIILWLLKHLAIFYITLVFYSSKRRQENLEVVKELLAKQHNLIFAVWHGRQLIMPKFLYKLGQMNAIASTHLDAKILGMVLTSYNTNVIYGSSNKGGKEALIKALRALRQKNNHLCITPDGPKGPRMRVNSAIIDIAKHTGAVIIPTSFSAKKSKFLRSWDRFLVPAMFNEMVVHYGTPISVAKNIKAEELDELKQQLENSLNNDSWKLDKQFKHEKIMPDDA